MNDNLSRTFHRETAWSSGVGDEKVVRQHGTTGVYAGLRVEVRPLPRGKGLVIAWNAGANVHARFATAVTQGIQAAASMGVSTGFELTDLLISVEDGSYHEEDSTEAAFREVAQEATITAIRRAHPIVLEAVSICRATFPEEYAGAIKIAVTSKHAQLNLSQSEPRFSEVAAFVPTAQVDKFLRQLLEITEGQAKISIQSGGCTQNIEPPDVSDVWSSVT